MKSICIKNNEAIATCPFYQSEELHEVGVGPIHAGVIEPGHFRFICNGEQMEIDYSRTIALELERIVVHTGDLSALCTDIAYQLGSSVFGRLRPLLSISCRNGAETGFQRA